MKKCVLLGLILFVLLFGSACEQTETGVDDTPAPTTASRVDETMAPESSGEVVAVTVDFKSDVIDGIPYVWAILSGQSAEDDTAWTYETDKYIGATLSAISEIEIHDGIYYYTEGNAIRALRLSDGSEVWENHDGMFGLADHAFDRLGNLYLFGGEGGGSFVAIDTNGETLKKISFDNMDCYFPGSIVLEGSNAILSFDHTPNNQPIIVNLLDYSYDFASQGYTTSTVFENDTYYIQHTDIDTEGYYVDLSYEIPVFKKGGAGIQTINEYFEALETDLSSSIWSVWNELKGSIMDAPYPPTSESHFMDTYTTYVHTFAENIISVSHSWSWFTGGVPAYGINGYTFDAQTGELLHLGDVLTGTENTIKAGIASSLRNAYPGIREDIIAAMYQKPLDQIDFYIENNQYAVAVFDKYEIGAGADGMFTAELRDLSLKKGSSSSSPPALISSNDLVPTVRMSAVTGVTATSWLSEPQYNTYHTPDRLIDNDLSTAWVEGVDGNGIGESFTVTLDGVYKVSGCILYPGYQKSEEQYLKNSSPASVRLTFSDGSWIDYNLEDVRTGHQLTLPESIETSSLTVSILSVYRGNVYEDTCISEISLF